MNDSHDAPDDAAPIAATWRQMFLFGLVGPWFSAAILCLALLACVPGLLIHFAPDLAEIMAIAPERIPNPFHLREWALLACGALVATVWYRRLLLGTRRFGVHIGRVIVVAIAFIALYHAFWAIEAALWAAHAHLILGVSIWDAWDAGLEAVDATSRLEVTTGSVDPVDAGFVLLRYFVFTIATSWALMMVAGAAIGEGVGPFRAWALTRGRRFALGLAIALAGLPAAALDLGLRADAAASEPTVGFIFEAAADFCLLLWITGATFIAALEFARATGRRMRA